MNIKRAFLAAVAVMLVPGYAMAQSTVTFSTTVSGSGGGDAGTPDMTITCNGGIPLEQTAPAGTTFSVTNINIGDVCTVGASGQLDTGWTAEGYICTPSGAADANGCTFTMVDGTSSFDTELTAVPVPFDFVVSYSWDISDDADPDVTDGAMIETSCTDVWDGSGLATLGPDSTPATNSAGGSFTAYSNVTPDPAGSTVCSATWVGLSSAVEGSAGCEESATVGDTEVSCSLSATAFFEGIPTLSQYGMAIMVLLMLGVGFVGFRRFV